MIPLKVLGPIRAGHSLASRLWKVQPSPDPMLVVFGQERRQAS
jgi:hypothetical protein